VRKIGDKDLENLISNIGNDEVVTAQKEAQMDRLKQLIKKQKKEMGEQESLINELQSKVNNMFELPADVEELKAMVGDQRAELNSKNQQLEMMYGQVAGVEAELKNTQLQITPLSKNLESYIAQVGELKAGLIEKDGINKLREKEIQELRIQVDNHEQNFSRMETEFQNKVGSMNTNVQDTFQTITLLKTELAEKQAKISMLSGEVESKNSEIAQKDQFCKDMESKMVSIQNEVQTTRLSSDGMRTKIEGELKEEIFKAKGDFGKQRNDLETKILDLEMALKDATQKAESAEKQLNEMRERWDEVQAKRDELFTENQEKDDILKQKDAQIADLQDFKNKNENTAINMKGLVQLFETEPLFKCFNLVNNIGEMNIEDLKSALGVPSVTTNKYVQQFIKVDVFEISENGKITLKYKMLKD
jgi:chromosome segregation ATPase